MKNLSFFSIGLSVVLSSTALLSCSDDGNNNPTPGPQTTIVQYSGSFVASNPQVVTTATGNATGSYNTSTRQLTYQLTWNNLTSNPGDMHFHDANLTGNDIIIPITGFPVAVTGTYTAMTTLSAIQATDLDVGKLYVQIHTQNYPGGEVIATLTKSGSTNQPPPSGY